MLKFMQYEMVSKILIICVHGKILKYEDEINTKKHIFMAQ